MLPGKMCGEVIQCEGEMWKSEERKKEMTAPITLPPLDEQTLTKLRRRYDDTSDAETRTRYQMLLLSVTGQTSTQIAQIVLRSQDTVVRVLKRFFAGGLDAVPRRTAPGRVRTVTAAWEAELVRVIELDPHEVGEDTANWTTERLAGYLGKHTGVLVTEETVRVYLHAHDYVCKRPTWTLRRKAEEKADYVGNACVEVLLAGATAPELLPVNDLVEADLWDQLPADLPALLALLPQADLYLQDEFQVAFHPTLTRVWSRKGRRGQRLVEAPGDNRKVYGFGLVDWRDGWFDGRVAPGRTAPACGCGDSFSGTRTNSRRGASSYRQSICTRQGSKCSSATCSGRIINLEAFSSSGKLPVVEIRVFSITCQQFFVSAALGNLSFVYDDDCGGVTDSRETVCNDE